MNRKKIFWIGLAVLFFGTMAVLTVTVRRIHNAALPQVVTGNPVRADFHVSYTDENGVTGETVRKLLAVPESVLDDTHIYVIYEAEKNGELRSFVTSVEIETGLRENGYAEVISGVGRAERIVLQADRELTEGAEVLELFDREHEK